ncbi:MAG TPA: MBL fold metallo-hydrolase [Burkholderiaceae bacterium]|nr:MBL fold metallo-hydrolase [Burkholderiaceae bacterium]
MANPHERELHYPLGDAVPAQGRALTLAPGVRWVRMGLPFALDHINLWLLEDRIEGVDGWTVVDCGITSDATKAAWEEVFAHELGGRPVLRVIATHMHPDHIGLAHWLTERWGCRLWVSATDYNAARMASLSTTGFGGERAAAFFASHGLTDPEAVAKVRARANYYAGMVPAVPASFRRLMDGQVLSIGGRAWHCIAGYGHAPEHIALHCPELEWAPRAPEAPAPRGGAPELGAARRSGVLISGDMVLPRISTNVSVYDIEPESNPLTLYLASLQRYAPLAPDTLVLPSHGRPFTGLHARMRQLRAHHDERLAEVVTACRERACHAAELLPLLFKRALDLHQTTFAMGEAVAHLHALWFEGRLRRERGEDGVWRFRALVL